MPPLFEYFDSSMMITQMTSLIRVPDVDANFKYHSCISDEVTLSDVPRIFFRTFADNTASPPSLDFVVEKRWRPGRASLLRKAVRTVECSFLNALDDDSKQTKDKHMSKLA